MTIGWTAQVQVRPGLFDLTTDKGLLLKYLGQAVVTTIQKRCGQSLGADGKSWEGYEVAVLKRNEDGSIYRDSRGRWTVVRHQMPRPTLWSNKELPPGQHALENMAVTPQRPPKDQQSVRVSFKGERDGLTHYMRMGMASGQIVDENGYKAGDKAFMAITDQEWSQILREFDADGALAFIDRERKAIDDFNAERARRKQERADKRRAAEAKRALMTTEQKMRAARLSAKRLGINFSENDSLDSIALAIAAAKKKRSAERRAAGSRKKNRKK